MIFPALIFFPLILALLTWIFRKNGRASLAFLGIGALGHAFLVLCAIRLAPLPFFWHGEELLGLDALGIAVLSITALLFVAAAFQSIFHVPADLRLSHGKHLETPTFVICLLGFLSTMTLVILARNFGLLWVAVEATTLASAPLILFHRSGHSLEAMWKYLLICSVGIGLALFGTMLLATATAEGGFPGLGFSSLQAHIDSLHRGWFKAAFIFILAGYGTKMGLAPFHTWLPDAHSEAPGTVSALLSGALLNCSFLGIVRVLNLAPWELKPFCNTLLVTLGVLSLAVAAFFIIRQSDFKRMLAYSSVEHMGLIAILWGIGESGFAVLHMLGHSLIKMTLFCLAGNILLAYGTRQVVHVKSLFGVIPKNGMLWLLGIFLICGAPSSPLFVTEFLLIRSADPWLGTLILLLLFLVFAGMMRVALGMVCGRPEKETPADAGAVAAEHLTAIPLLMLVLALGFGAFLSWNFMIGRF